MIYLDNSATTFIKPKEVIKAVNDSLLHYNANPGRSGHKASIASALQIETTRENLSRYFNNGSPNRVIFTHNCTEALNIAILGNVKSQGHIICTENEHNSVLRPLEHLKQSGQITYSIAFQEEKTGITLNDIKTVLQSNTYMIICNHISNVNGAIARIKEIGEFCKKHNIIFVVDGAQSAGHIQIDMKENCIDFLSIAGHKGLYAPLSIGALIMGEKFDPSPILFGGTGTNSLQLYQPDIFPEKLESGTISTPLILGLNAGLNFVNQNFDQIKNKIDDLSTYLNFELNKLEVSVYTEPENAYGVVAFNIEDLDSNEVANILNEKYDICVRGGYHCAPIKHKALGTLNQGAVRASISYFNTFTEIQKLIYAVKHIKQNAKRYKL